jgi:hypothetical protein
MSERTFGIAEVGSEVLACISGVLSLEPGTLVEDDEPLGTYGLDRAGTAALLDQVEMVFRLGIDRSESTVIFHVNGDDQCVASYAVITDCVVRSLRKRERLEE